MTEQDPDQTTRTCQISSLHYFPQWNRRVAAIFDMQTEFFATLERINRDSFDRAKSELRLVSELSGKLTAVRSVHDIALANIPTQSRGGHCGD
jgi:hypothetical protein